jgi:pantothenate kinase-related protein Tda10
MSALEENTIGTKWGSLGRPLCVGVAGGTAAGKVLQCSDNKPRERVLPGDIETLNDNSSLPPKKKKREVCNLIAERLRAQSRSKPLLLSLSDFYKPLDANQGKLAQKGNYNFDHPGECLLS